MTRKTILLCTSICSIIAVSLTSSTLAFLTANSKLDNPVKIGYNSTVIEEVFPTPSPVIPDEPKEYEKDVSVINKDSVPCYIRLSVSFSNDTIGKNISYINLNTEDWIYINESENGSLEGYYYYKYPVAPGQSTASLFEGIQSTGNLDLSDNGAEDNFQIIIYEESIQCSPHTTYLDAWDSFIRE